MDVLKDFIAEFDADIAGFSLIVEDNGRVAYAYLIALDREILADVWLYNRVDAPFEAEWTSPENAPFVNPAEYVVENCDFNLPSALDQISVDWEERDGRLFAKVLIRGEVVGLLTEGSKPGWSKLAKKNGPLAKVLERP